MAAEETRLHRLYLGGAKVDLMSHGEVLAAVRRQLRHPFPPPLCLASANLDHLGHFGVGAQTQTTLDDSDRCRWMVLLDGKPLQWAARPLTHGSCDLLAGSYLLPDLLSIAEATQARFGLLGCQPETHEALAAFLRRTFPDLQIAGMWSPTR